MQSLYLDYSQFITTRLHKNTCYRVGVKCNFVQQAATICKVVARQNITSTNIILLAQVNKHSIDDFLKKRKCIYKKVKKLIVEVAYFDELVTCDIYRKKIKLIINDIKEHIFKCLIRIKGIPVCYFLKTMNCLTPANKLLMIRGGYGELNTFQIKNCRACPFLNYCRFNYHYERSFDTNMCSFEDRPEEIAIEVTQECNLRCSFCFQDNNPLLSSKKIFINPKTVYTVLNTIREWGIKRVRFTGGEPLLHREIINFIKSAKEKKLYVVLNTNAILITPNIAEKLVRYVDNFEIPIIYCESKRVRRLSGDIKRKICSLDYLHREIKRQKLERKKFRANTILLRDNYMNINSIYRLVKRLRFNVWGVNRMIALDKSLYFPTHTEIDFIVHQIYWLKNKEKEMSILYGNGLPFCCSDPLKMDYLSSGTYWHDSRNRLFIDCRGFIKPFYYNYHNLGPINNLANLKNAWSRLYIRRFRTGEMIPQECQRCLFQHKCGGGNRFCAFKHFGDYTAKDILYNEDNRKDFYFM